MSDALLAALTDVGAAPIAPPAQPEPPASDPSLTQRFRALLQWRDDVDNPEMIQGDSYSKHHLAFPEAHMTEHEAQVISDLANAFYRRMGSARRVAVVQKQIFKPWISGDVPQMVN